MPRYRLLNLTGDAVRDFETFESANDEDAMKEAESRAAGPVEVWQDGRLVAIIRPAGTT